MKVEIEKKTESKLFELCEELNIELTKEEEKEIDSRYKRKTMNVIQSILTLKNKKQ